MSELEPLYVIQVKPKMTSAEYKYLGFEDAATAKTAEDAWYEKRKAEDSGNYAQVRVVKLCSFYTTEIN